MKNTLLVIIMLVFGIAGTITGGETIEFQSIASIAKLGTLPVSPLKVFQNMEQLSAYLSEISSDINELSDLPDFSAMSSIAIGFAQNNRYYRLIHTIKKIVPGDTVIIVMKVDSQQLDTTMHIQPGYQIEIITIPKTDKPIITGFDSPSAIRKQNTFIGIHRTVNTSAVKEVFDLSGRSSKNTFVYRNFIIVHTGSRQTEKLIKIH